jgi:hypothetical protein
MEYREMGKKLGFFRTTISVPRELKRQMDAVKEPVNWSAIACRAFEEKLAEIITKKEEKTMFAIIQRLRASKPDIIYQQGQADGRRWASERAEYEDLLRLERLYEAKRAGRDWEDFFDRGYDEASVGEHLIQVVYPPLSPGICKIGGIVGDPEGCSCAYNDFWKSYVGEDASKIDNPSYIRGFAEGALTLWREVKDKL